MRWRIAVMSLSLMASALLVRWTPTELEADEPPQAAQKKAATEKKDAGEKKDAADKKDKNEEKPPPAAQPPAVNPLQNLFQKLLPAAPRAATPRTPNGQPVDPDARDHIDARAAKDRKQAELLRKASSAVESQDWVAALELLQTLLAQDEDSVERIGREWYSVRDRAMRLMLKLPADVLHTFRQRSSAEAARRLGEAEASGRIDRLAQIAARFLVLE